MTGKKLAMYLSAGAAGVALLTGMVKVIDSRVTAETKPIKVRVRGLDDRISALHSDVHTILLMLRDYEPERIDADHDKLFKNPPADHDHDD